MTHFTIFFLFFLVFTQAKGKVIIEGKLNNIDIKEELYYYTPIDGYFNQFYNPQKLIFKSKSVFRIETKIAQAGFISIVLPDKTLRLLVHQNDTIYFEMNYSIDSLKRKYKFQTIHFKGNNAFGHKNYSANSAYVLPQDFLLKNSFSKKNTTINEFFDSAMGDLKTLLKQFDSLFGLKQIDADFHKIITTDVESNFAWNVINLFGFILISKDKKLPQNEASKPLLKAISVNRDIYTQSNYDSIRLMIYRKFDPFETNILNSTMGIWFHSSYIQDIYSGFIKDQIVYDSAFLDFNPSRRYFGFMKGRFLELAWAQEIYWGAMAESDDNELKKSYSMFAEYFPTSPFLQHLRMRLATAFDDKNFDRNLSGEIELLNYNGYPTLKAIAKECFNNKYLFVDIWATWCSPCLQDFMYKNQLKSFLENINVKTLYISIDEFAEKEKWKKFIYNKNLFGTHYLASEEFVSNLKKQIYGNEDITLPRYLLLDKNANILAFNLPRPSDLESLKKELNKLIGKK